MRVCICRIQLYLHSSHSLKDKRQVIRSILDRFKNNNVSVAEVGMQNNHQRAELGFCAVSNDSNHLRQKFEKMMDFIEDNYPCRLLNVEIDIV